MSKDILQDDCTQCAGLCCIAFAFDKSDLFGFDKEAGQPCHHLGSDFQCAIHKSKAQKGFLGCVSYTCHGAGQRVVQECFDGKDWRSSPEILAPMMEAFQKACRVHKLILLLTEAGKLPLSSHDAQRLVDHLEELKPKEPLTLGWLQNCDVAGIERRVSVFLRSLESLVVERVPQSGPRAASG